MDTDIRVPEDLWDEMLREHWSRIRKQESLRSSLESLQYHFFNDTLAHLDLRARQTAIPALVLCLRPAFQHLAIFTNAINNFVQTQANLLGFIWGSISTVISGAMQYSSTLELMTDMLDDLTRTITRFNRYPNLLSRNTQLQVYLRILYDEYVQFCISAMLCYQRVSWCSFTCSENDVPAKTTLSEGEN